MSDPIRDPLPLLRARGLRKDFASPSGWGRPAAAVRAVDGVDLEIAPSETLGLVGESGCGKSTLARLLVRLVPPTGGTVEFEGRDVLALRGADLRALRRRLQIVFQDPYGSLNPRLTVGAALGEVLRVHRLAGRAEAGSRAALLLQQVGLAPAHAASYPHELSGGQRQRVGIARALALGPRLVVCDEPVSALDVSVQAQILNLLLDLQARLGLSYLFISHDLRAVRQVSRRVAVMYLGRLVETGPADQLFRDPLHPYTRALLSAVPRAPADGKRGERIVLRGDVPSPRRTPSGCPFHPRCPEARQDCAQRVPPLAEIVPGRSAACWLRMSDAPALPAAPSPGAAATPGQDP